MLTRDEGDHKLDKGDQALAVIWSGGSFDAERRGSVHDIHRIEGLINGRITVLNQLGSEYQFYSNRNRDQYFARVLEKIKADNREQKVVFLDSDNGVEIKNSNHKHVRLREIKGVWDSLSLGDYLVIYQHHPRERDFIIIKKKQLSATLGLAVDAITHKTHTGVTFFWIKKHTND